MKKGTILPRHRRAQQPPRMQLTQRDAGVVLAVHDYRTLRRDQIESLFFPSPNTANERLKRLYQHRFLDRRWLPVEYGQGMSQAIYLLDERGADLVAERRGSDRSQVHWRAAHNHIRSPFLEHSLMINDARIAFTTAAERGGCQVEKWVGEAALKALGDYVHIPTARGGRRKVAVIPDGYLVLRLGDRRAHFFLEIDRSTLSNRRWRERTEAYLKYIESGRYGERYGTRSLRILTVTTGPRRLVNLKRTTEEAGGGELFWFTALGEMSTRNALEQPIWQVAGQAALSRLIG
jgi:hypothetical protein